MANPFKNGNRMKNTLGLEDGERASASDYLVCSLGSWHYLSEERTYVIRFLESAPAGDAVAVRVYLDWADDTPARPKTLRS